MKRGSTLACASLAVLALALPAATLAAGSGGGSGDKADIRVLVFTKAAGGAHPATSAGVSAIQSLGRRNDIDVTATSSADSFTDTALRRYAAVVLLNTSGDVLDDAQQAALQRYLEAGGGLVAVHSAIETEPGWQFMTDALGARASGLSAAQEATLKVADRVHPSSADLPEYWSRTDRWFNFDRNVRGFQHVLATVDEGTYTGGTMGFDHPIAWCQDFRGGRVWYTGRGGTPQAYSSESLREHLLGGIEWAAGAERGDCGATVLSNYEMTVIASNAAGPQLAEPIGFEVVPDRRVVSTGRLGQVFLHDPAQGTTTMIANIPVYSNSEDGMYGPAVDRNFESNRWIYLYYAPVNMDPPFPPTTPAGNAPTRAPDPSAWDVWQGYFQLSRFKLVETPTPQLDLASEQKILKVPVNRGACCHVAGDIAFDSKNNLWLVTGDDTPAGGGNSGGYGPFNDQIFSEIQQIAIANATGGTFTLTFDGQTTAPIAFPMTPAAVEQALEALSSIDNVVVTTQGANLRVNFRGSLAEVNVPLMTGNASGLTGTSPTLTITVPTVDGQPAEGAWFNAPHVDARRSALNTNDLRGKILRIRVESNGSYSIPRGNLFDEGRDRAGQTRPEIYAMGLRNPFRLNLDERDDAYIADYSPDARLPEVFRGPAGTGRIMVVREPGNYGWPLCYSPTLPYYRWNFNTSTPLDAVPQTFECGNRRRGPANTSRWNTGLAVSPPVERPEVWYSFNDNNPPTPPATAALGTPCFAYYNGSGATTCPQVFPELGPGGGVGPHGAAPYDFDRRNPNPTKFPEYYDGSFIFGEFTRDYLREIRLDSRGGVLKINNVLNCGQFPTPFLCDNPMDLKFAQDGNFYLLTYGDGFFRANPDAKLVRFSYVRGARAPTVVLSATPRAGPAPLTVNFSSAGSSDPDANDSITFAWDFQNDGTVDSTAPDASFTYTANGNYTAKLTVTDSTGRSAVATTTISVGNTPPSVAVTTPVNGGFFSFGDRVPWTIAVTDPEDGAIDCSRVKVTFVLGHDTHGHGGDEATGCSGVFQTNAADAQHAGGYLFGAISASYTDNAGATETAQAVIQQRRQEGEFLPTQGTTIGFTADGNGIQVVDIDPGEWISLNPVNFQNVGSITFRVSGTGTAPRAEVELRLGAPDGPLVATIPISGTGGNNSYVDQTTPVGFPIGTHELYLVFRSVTGGPTAGLFNLSRFELVGQGVTAP
jgi:type 1 glutamine amidotransferase